MYLIMSDKNISWGIIGCGNVTELKSGPAFNKVPNSRLHAVMRRNALKAEDYAKRHGVPVWYADADQLINDPNINAVYIATPPLYHEAYALAALEKGKFVYVEKPVALNVAACMRMREAVIKSNGKLVVAHYRRGLPMFNHIKDLVKNGTVGKIRSIRLNMCQPLHPAVVAASEDNWRVDPAISGGGYFYDLAPHQLDIIQYIFGVPLSWKGVSAKQSGQHKAEDAVAGVMLMENEIVFEGHWNFNAPALLKDDSCQIIGEKGYIQFPFFGNEVRLVTEEKVEMMPFTHPENIQHPMIHKVVSYLQGNGENPCSIDEAICSLQVMEDFVYGV
jgi:predicted dehydrogenase